MLYKTIIDLVLRASEPASELMYHSHDMLSLSNSEIAFIGFTLHNDKDGGCDRFTNPICPLRGPQAS